LVRKTSFACFSNLAPNVLSPKKHQLFSFGKELQSEDIAKEQRAKQLGSLVVRLISFAYLPLDKFISGGGLLRKTIPNVLHFLQNT